MNDVAIVTTVPPLPRPPKAAMLVLLLLMVGAVVGMAVTLSQGLNTVGIHHVFTTPLTASWICCASLVMILGYLSWVTLLYNHITSCGIWYWLITGALLASLGFMQMIAFATMPNEALAAGLSILFWTVPGLIIVRGQMKINRQRKILHHPTVAICCIREDCKRPVSWCTGFLMIFLLFTQACAVAIWVQALLAASDFARFPPMGQLLTVTSEQGISLQMHIACFGPASDTTNLTWILEHGGGSNSASLKYIADQMALKGYRSCVYDRLGYGWTKSYVTMSDRSAFESDASLLGKLLSAAGEKPPYACVGHSAGAEKCLQLAMTFPDQVKSIGFLDGYPDYVRAGSISGNGVFRPNYGLIGVLKLFAFLVGPTGFTRGIVGKADANYVPQEWAAANTANYAQSRFWFAQLWDVVADMGAGANHYTFKKLNGTQDPVHGMITYGRTLNVTVGVYPAYSTVTALNCDDYPNDYCCGEGKGGDDCKKAAEAITNYHQQSQLYASSIGIVPGTWQVAPKGSEHSFPHHRQYADWIVGMLVSNLTVF